MNQALTFAILLAVAVSWAVASYVVNHQITQAMRQMVQASALLRNQTDTDMEHDAIRGDVLGILAARTEPSLNAQELATSLKDRTASFRELYDATLAYEHSKPVHDSAAAVKPDVEMYLASADQVADATLGGQPVSPEALAQFNAKFEALEGSLAGVSDTIEKHVAETRVIAGDAARHGTYVTLGCLLLIVGTILMVWRSFVKHFLRPIFEIKGAVERTEPCRLWNARLDRRSYCRAQTSGGRDCSHDWQRTDPPRQWRSVQQDRSRFAGRVCQPEG